MEPFFYLHAELDYVNTLQKDRRRTQIACLSVFGKDVSGKSVVIRIIGYRIHFFISFSDVDLQRYCCMRVLNNNENNIIVEMKSVSGKTGMLLNKNHQVADKNNYADTTLTNVVQVEVRKKEDIAKVISKIDKAVCDYDGTGTDDSSGPSFPTPVSYYNSNMDAIISATRRLNLDPCCWCSIDTSRMVLDETSAFVGREYTFYNTTSEDLTGLFSDLESSTDLLPPSVKIMSFDIECLSSEVEKMPDATKDCIIQVSSVLSKDALGRDIASGDESRSAAEATGHVLQRHVFTIGSCNHVEGVQVHECKDEEELLNAFIAHMHDEDPDILTGYNINAFDLPYLFRRLDVYGIKVSMGKGDVLADGESGQYRYVSGGSRTRQTRISGRTVFDMYVHMRKEVVLRSYTLNSVSAHFLGKMKEDVGYKEIPALFNGDACSRARLAKYCVKDAQLVLELAFKTQTFLHAFERCKVFRTMLQYMVEFGQQVRFYSMLLAWCSERNILVNDITSSPLFHVYSDGDDGGEVRSTGDGQKSDVNQKVDHDGDNEEDIGIWKRPRIHGENPVSIDCEDFVCDRTEPSTSAIPAIDRTPSGKRKGKKVGYDGATVLDPVVGLYHTPVICLDYASLYPSIMIAHNLCFTTFVQDKRQGEELAARGMAEQSPLGHYFLTQNVKKGVVPSILEMLLEKRAEVRKSMTKLHKDSLEYNLLDGQQSALKIAANSIYGAIGCVVNILHFVEIPSSVTAYGRCLIKRTKECVEANYEGTRIVYGDTDSVMVNLPNWSGGIQSLRKCATIGKRMADTVTKVIGRDPIRLQFETIYCPFFLCTKKRYAARVYQNLDETDKKDTEICSSIKYKGLQVVRRDNCTFATRLMKFVLESLMDGSVPIEQIMQGLQLELKRLFDGQINTKELVITKEWKKKCVTGQAHDRLAQRMQLRDPNSAPNMGDRVPYVIITTPYGAKLCERAEHPLYAIENNLRLDLLYYAENQVAKPIADLLCIALQHQGSSEVIKDRFWPPDAPRRVSDKRRGPGESIWTRKASIGSHRITDFFNRLSDQPVGDEAMPCQPSLADIEDVLEGLAKRCLACKDNEVEAVRSCRNHECETLYERFTNMKLRTRIIGSSTSNCVPSGDSLFNNVFK